MLLPPAKELGGWNLRQSQRGVEAVGSKSVTDDIYSDYSAKQAGKKKTWKMKLK